MKSWKEKIIEIGTYLLVFFTPILYFGGNRYLSYSTSKTFFFYGFLEIIFAFWLYQYFVDKSYRFKKKDLFIFIPFSVYVAWLTLAGIFGVDPSFSFWSSFGRGTGLLTIYHIFIFVFIISSLIRKYSLRDYGYKLMSCFIAGTTILTISIWLGSEGFNLPIEVLEKSKGGGLIGNSSLAASVLVFTLFFSGFLLTVKQIKNSYRIVLFFVVALIIFSPLFINTFGLPISARGAFLGIISGLFSGVLFYLFLSQKLSIKIIGTILIFISLVASVFFWVKLISPGNIIHEKFSAGATYSRFIFWDIGEKAISDSPILGYGPENYRYVYQKYFNPEIYNLGSSVEVWNDRAHNIIIDTGVSGGYLAVLFYLAFILSLFYGLFKAFNDKKISRIQASVVGAMIVGYFVQNLFVFDSFVSLVALSILTGLVFGLFAEKIEYVKKQEVSKNKINTYIFIIFITILTSWVFFSWMPSRKAITFSKVIEMPLNKRYEYYNDLLKGSSASNGEDIGAFAENAYSVYSKNQAEIKKDEKLLFYSLKDLESLTGFLEKVSKKEKNDYRLRLNLARLYNIYFYLSLDKSLLEKALIIEEEAILLSTNDPQLYWTYATTKYLIGDKNGALELVKKSIEIAPNIAFSGELLDQFSR